MSSYRIIRNFCESLRRISYTKVISMNIVYKPGFINFQDIILFLIKLRDPNIKVDSDLSTQNKRVKYIQLVGQLFFLLYNVKLNLLKLYSGGTNTINEIFKVISIIEKENELSKIQTNPSPPEPFNEKIIYPKVNKVSEVKTEINMCSKNVNIIFKFSYYYY